MTFIVATLNHFRAIRSWADAHDAQVELNVRTFELEVKARNRYFRLKPQFLATMDGRFGHVTTLTPDATGLIGWFPYRPPLRWELASDKLSFKHLLKDADYETPEWWTDPKHASLDYILKRSKGSFGYGLYGPYAAGERPPSVPPESATGQIFAERFIRGRNVKMWFWGHTPFFAHLHAYPTIEGDDAATVRELVAVRLQQVGASLDDSAEMTVLRQALSYQDFSLDQVLKKGQSAWLDYRYGRRFVASPVTAVSDNAWAGLAPRAQQQAQALGRLLGDELLKTMPLPVLYSVDAVLDDHDTLWWLEMNSNPILPPDGYPLILATLFGEARTA